MAATSVCHPLLIFLILSLILSFQVNSNIDLLDIGIKSAKSHEMEEKYLIIIGDYHNICEELRKS